MSATEDDFDGLFDFEDYCEEYTCTWCFDVPVEIVAITENGYHLCRPCFDALVPPDSENDS